MTLYHNSRHPHISSPPLHGAMGLSPPAQQTQILTMVMKMSPQLCPWRKINLKAQSSVWHRKFQDSWYPIVPGCLHPGEGVECYSAELAYCEWCDRLDSRGRELLLQHVRTLPCCVKFTQSSLNNSDLEGCPVVLYRQSHVIRGCPSRLPWTFMDYPYVMYTQLYPLSMDVQVTGLLGPFYYCKHVFMKEKVFYVM